MSPAMLTQTLPIRVLDDGTWRIGDTRVPVERVVYCHDQGQSPEQMVESVPTLAGLEGTQAGPAGAGR